MSHFETVDEQPLASIARAREVWNAMLAANNRRPYAPPPMILEPPVFEWPESPHQIVMSRFGVQDGRPVSRIVILDVVI